MAGGGWSVTARPAADIDAGAVLLRRWTEADAAALYGAVVASSAHLQPWMPWAEGYDHDATSTFLAGCGSDWEAGRSFQYSMRAGDDSVVGSCGLMTRQGPGILEIGYWVAADRVRRGFATAATGALAHAALALKGVDRVEVHHDEANLASAGVPRALGFERTGRVEKDPAAPAETGVEIVWTLRRPSTGSST